MLVNVNAWKAKNRSHLYETIYGTPEDIYLFSMTIIRPSHIQLFKLTLPKLLQMRKNHNQILNHVNDIMD